MGTKLILAMALLGAVEIMAQPTPPPAPPPAPRAHGAVRVLPAHGTYLGVGVADIDSERAKTLKLNDARGAEVTMVGDGTPAAKAGIRVGDVILEYNGQPVQGKEELQRLVRETPAGRQVKIGLWRNGASVTVIAAVEDGTTPNFSFDSDNWPFNGGSLPNVPSMPSIDIPRMLTTFQSTALGVECESLGSNSQLAEFFGVKDGLLVRSVSRNSPAEKAGIKAGDVIVKVGDTRIANTRDLAVAVRANRTNGALPVTVMRNRREMALTLTLQETRPEHF